jgi:hypothetical protein
MLDSLDEIEPHRQELCVKRLNLFLNDYYRSSIVICSRSKEYESYTEKLKLNAAIFCKPLDNSKIHDYLSSVSGQSFHKLVEASPMLLEMLRTPFFISMFAITYSSFKAERVEIEDVQAISQHLMDEFVEKSINSKSGKLEQKYHSTAQFKKFAIWLAIELEKQAADSFSIGDFQQNLLKGRQRKIHAFLTNSTISLILLFSYFVGHLFSREAVAAFAINSVIFSCLLLVSGFSNHARLESILRTLLSQLVIALIFGMYLPAIYTEPIVYILLLTATMFVCFLVHRTNLSLNDTKTSFPPATVDKRILLNKALISTMGGLSSGILVGIFSFLSMSNHLNLVALTSLTNILGVSLLFVFSYGISGNIFSDLRTEKSSKEIKGFLLSSLICFLFFSLVPALMLMTLSGQMIDLVVTLPGSVDYSMDNVVPLLYHRFRMLSPVFGYLLLLCSCCFGVSGFLVFGGIEGIKHFYVRLILSIDRKIPWNYTEFLEYARERLLLKRVGGRYQFMHKLLQEHFSNMPI